VRAVLYSVDRGTGATRSTVAAVSSDSSPLTGTALRRSAHFTHVFDHNVNYYYVRVEMARTTPSESVRALGVALEYREPPPSEPPELAGITALHNQVRAQAQPVPSPALPPLQWDESLAATAGAWAAQCVDNETPIGLVDHNPNRSNGHPYLVGENIYGSSGTATAQGAVSLWAAEAANYDYASNTCAPNQFCGHYTQIVWRDTLKVGCALRICPGLEYGNTIVCNYGPTGNFNGTRPY